MKKPLDRKLKARSERKSSKASKDKTENLTIKKEVTKTTKTQLKETLRLNTKNATNKNKPKIVKVSAAQTKKKFGIFKDLVAAHNQNAFEERNSKHKPLDLLILLILNQSTSDYLADVAFKSLKEAYPNYETLLLENNPKKIAKAVKICGLAPTKAIYILNALQYLQERNWLDLEMNFINEMTDKEALDAITAIKGVGIKSASCLLMFSFRRGTFPIDTHVYRILQRVGGILSSNVLTTPAHKIIQPLISGSQAWDVHVGLINLGREICTAPKKPNCKECYLKDICEFCLI